MKAILPPLDADYKKPLYLQLYEYLSSAIINKDISPGEKLPSLRALSSSLSVSLTTVEMAYNQLAVEGFIYSKPCAGYFVSSMSYPNDPATPSDPNLFDETFYCKDEPYVYDLSCFDFTKWKKCINQVLNQRPELLLVESNPQGEEVLRYEIAKYVYGSRGVTCTPEQVVIGAGTQQITVHLSRILKKMNIHHVAVEDPGYLPVRNIFRDNGFTLTPVPVKSDGISITMLPKSIPSAVYVNPSNQFPTGAVTPIGKRYELLSWASGNNSYILEDDYDSELRYFGKPIPALQGLDHENRVVYLGSFSSTLFASIKISYMILPRQMVPFFHSMQYDYSQTCSKTEQLALALFMEQGHYIRGINKLRRLYSQKLALTLETFALNSNILAINSSSGVSMMINVTSAKSMDVLCQEAKELGVLMSPAPYLQTDTSTAPLIFHYNRLPLEEIPKILDGLFKKWF